MPNKIDKWARLRRVAEEEPKEMDAGLAQVADALGTMSDALTNLREHLDLIEAPKSASMRVRIASKRRYASTFKRMAEEAPEVVADAIAEVYNSLDDVAEAIETLSDNIGIDLDEFSVDKTEDEFEIEGEPSETDLVGEVDEEEAEDYVNEESDSAEEYEDFPEEETEEIEVTSSKKKAEAFEIRPKHHHVYWHEDSEGKKVGELQNSFSTSREANDWVSEQAPGGHYSIRHIPTDNPPDKHKGRSLTAGESKTYSKSLTKSEKAELKRMQDMPKADRKNQTGKWHDRLKDLETRDENERTRDRKKANGGFVTNRDEDGKPKSVDTLDVPEVEVSKISSRERQRQRIAKRHGIELK